MPIAIRELKIVTEEPLPFVVRFTKSQMDVECTMTESTEPPSYGETPAGIPPDTAGNPDAILDQIKGLLGAKDDTSRFVGLALLKAVLDNNEPLREDVNQIVSFWSAISPRFLDRLLKAGQNDKTTKEEAENMLDIAVAVLHTFTILLPVASRNDSKFVGRTEALIQALIKRYVRS